MKLHRKLLISLISNLIVILIVIYILNISSFKGYYSLLPTIPIYPDNEKDLEILKTQISKRTQGDNELFFETNVTPISAFLPYVEESYEELEKNTHKQDYIILFFKYLINRRRPYQIDRNMKPLSTLTSNTPSYPAGHAYQALLLADYLSKKYPEKKELFDSIALKCDECRVKAGIHYVSDGEFSRKLFKLFN